MGRRIQYYYWDRRLWPTNYAPAGYEDRDARYFRQNTGQTYPSYEEYEVFRERGLAAAAVVEVDTDTRQIVGQSVPKSPGSATRPMARSHTRTSSIDRPDPTQSLEFWLPYLMPVGVVVVMLIVLAALSVLSGGSEPQAPPPERQGVDPALGVPTAEPPLPTLAIQVPVESGSLPQIGAVAGTPAENKVRFVCGKETDNTKAQEVEFSIWLNKQLQPDNGLQVAYQIDGPRLLPINLEAGEEHFQDIVAGNPNGASDKEKHPCAVIVSWDGSTASWQEFVPALP